LLSDSTVYGIEKLSTRDVNLLLGAGCLLLGRSLRSREAGEAIAQSNHKINYCLLRELLRLPILSGSSQRRWN